MGRTGSNIGSCYSAPVGREEGASTPVPSGLCGRCTHARTVKSDRGSVFLFCKLSVTDGRFARYPRLPVLDCAGYAGKARHLEKEARSDEG